MLQVVIPGSEELFLEHLVLDFNGTLACEGKLLPDVAGLLHGISDRLLLHVLTGDTYGRAEQELVGIPCRFTGLLSSGQGQAKRAYVEQLGSGRVVCIGNGRNDALMLDSAGLAIAVIGPEGASSKTLLAADMVTRDIYEALALLSHPLRITATLRE